MADIKEPPKKGLIRGLLGRKEVPKSQKKEKEREDKAWQKKLFGYLEGFKKSFAALEGGSGDKKKGGLFGGIMGLFKKLLPMGMLAAIPAALMAMLGTLGLGVLVLGAFGAIWKSVSDAFKGYMKVKKGEWGNIDKISGAIGGFFGGTGSGFFNAITQGAKWAIIGATAGVFAGPPGMLAGAIIGLTIGAVAGWIGGEKIATWIDGTVRKFRNIFDMPEALSPEQAKLSHMAKLEAEKKMIAAAERIRKYKVELQDENTTYLRRIELRKLIAADEKILEDNKTIARNESRRLAESELGHMDNKLKEQRLTTQEAKLELQNAKALKNQAYLKVIWARAIHGEGSEEHLEAQKEFVTAKQKVTDAKKWLVDSQAQLKTMNKDRSDLRTELDKEHTTAMGNVRLFFKGETDWQRNLKDNFTQMGKALGDWFKNNIYDPGGAAIGPGGAHGTTSMRIFGVDMVWPKLSFPSWQEIKAALPWWLGGGGAEGGVTGVFKKHFDLWKWDLPSWEDAKKQMPKWLGGTVDAVEKAGAVIAGVAGVFGDAFNEWKLDVPSWEETKKSLPTWLGGTGSIGETVDLAFATFKDWKFVLPKWEDVKKELPEWLGGTLDAVAGTVGGVAGVFKKEFGNWKLDVPSWEETKKVLPTWLGGTGSVGETVEKAFETFDNWEFTLPKWADIKKELPWWVGGGIDATKTALQAFKDEFSKETTWTFTIPSWATIKALIPTWLGGTKGGESESLEEKAKPFAKWTFTIPSWADMKAMIPWWLGGTKGKKEDLTSDTVPETEKMVWPKLKMPDLSGVLNLPDWMTQKDFFKLEWPKITIQDLTEGVKDIVKAVLPDPVEDPWLYKLVPQKVYDWLGVPTKVREAQAELANAKIELQKLEQQRQETAAVKVVGEEGGYRMAMWGRMDTADERAEAIAEIDAELLEATQKVANADASLARTVANSRPHLVTDIGLIIEKHGFLPISTPKQLVRIPPSLSQHIAAQTSQMGALLSAAAAGSSGGTTTVNNVTVAPTTSNTSSNTTISENTYGTVNPYVSIAGAYG